MDHWRLDEDEAGFEDDRLDRLRLQQAEAARLHAESAEFYQLARATRERKVPPMPTPTPTLEKGQPADKRKRRDAALPAFKVHKKETTSTTGTARSGVSVPLAADSDGVRAPALASVDKQSACDGLPGMDAYGDDDSD